MSATKNQIQTQPQKLSFEDQLKQAVEDEADFVHELRVGRVLREARGDQYITVKNPEHGQTYTDPVSGKARQFDYRCQIWHERVPEVFNKCMCLMLAVECKNLRQTSPIVILGMARTQEEAYHTFIESNKLTSRPPWFNATSKLVRGQFYLPREFVGKEVKRKVENQAKLEGQEDVYSRWAQAITSSYEMAVDACRYGNNDFTAVVCSFVMPVVVVPSGRLWVVEYDDSGSIQSAPKQVEECQYLIGHEIPLDKLPTRNPVTLTHVHFVTIEGLRLLLRRFCGVNHGPWGTLFPADTEKLPAID